ncbi:nitrilase-related carbon-nitrogen hydrolase [Rhodococcus qingshengii]|uniref:nitrilase-related carbon-nitrogen hydrolase n=1 Tax=Rhodococcus qingshengii TaxID=334542 RepID=UPI0024B9407D|nr:nitrilase-related carbon-nitrogen hydrolase [Rhodococcus qingshengii]MDJ0441493.1 nitrilase-related carbon-nitrogen hydrolase [Rhodococcus qingshengii]
MRISVLQATARIGDIGGNLSRLEAAAWEAENKDAQVLVTPELFTCGYDPAAVHDIDGAAALSFVRSIARDTQIAIVVSTVEHEGAKRYIVAHMVSADGEVLTSYRKTHLFGSEVDYFTPGQSLPQPVSFEGVTVALGICYDVEYPEFVRTVTDSGVHLLLVPTAVPVRSASSTDTFDTTLIPRRIVPARALENTITIAYANHAGKDFAGYSCIALPDGEVIAAGPDLAEVIVADISRPLFENARHSNPYLVSRRRDLY